MPVQSRSAMTTNALSGSLPAPHSQTAAPERKRITRIRPSASRPVTAAVGEGQAVHSVAVRDRMYRWSLAVADIVAAGLAIILAAGIVGNQLQWATLLALPLVVVAGKIQGLYDRDELLLRKTTIDEAPKLFHLATLYTLGVTLLDDHFFSAPLDAPRIVLLWMSLLVLTVAARRGARTFSRVASEPERCLFIG